MRSSRLIAAISLFVALTAPVIAAPSLVNLIDENAPAVFAIHDVPKMVKNWERSPWAKTWNDEQMKKFLAPMRGQMKVDKWDEECKAATGYTLVDLLHFATGEAMVALTNADFSIDQTSEMDKRPLLFAIEVGGNADKIEKLIAENDEKEHEVSRIEEYAGVKLHVYPVSETDATAEFSWAMVDGVWLFSLSKTELTKAVDALKKGKCTAPLGESERFLRIKKETGEANGTLLVNVQSLLPLIQKALEAKGEKSGSNPLGLPPEELLKALGIDALREFYLGMGMGEDATDFSGGLTYSERRGILKVLAYQDGPPPQPGFVSAKWITVTTGRFSLAEAYTAIRELLDGLNPMVGGMIQGQIKNLNKQLGVDLERDLLGSLGNDLVTANAMRPGATLDSPTPLTEFDQLYALSLQNATAFTNAVDALKRMAGPQEEKLFVKREYLGHAIYTYAQGGTGPGQKGFSYAITPKYVFISAGTPAVIETALQGLDGKQPTLWQLPEVKEALVDVPEKAFTFEYQNTRAMIGSLIETATQMATLFAAKQKAAPESEDESDANSSDPSLLDLSAKPDASTIAKYWSNASGYAWRDSQGVYFHSKLNHVK